MSKPNDNVKQQTVFSTEPVATTVEREGAGDQDHLEVCAAGRRRSRLSRAIEEYREDAPPVTTAASRAAGSEDGSAHADGEEEGGDGAVELLPPSKGLTTEEAETLLEKYGRNELPTRSTPKWLIFLRLLYGPMPCVLWVCIIIEFALKDFMDGGILLGILLANACIGFYETVRAGDAVAALRSALKPVATAKRDGTWQQIDAALLVPGDLVKLAAGSVVPADCSINEGVIDVDEAALTGESLPVTMGTEHMPKMGSNVVRGEVEGTVQLTGKSTFFGKTAALLQSVESDLGNIHVILSYIMYFLAGFALLLCVVCFVYMMAKLRESFRRSLEFAVIVLVVSIPIALEIVVTTTLAVGSRQLSKHKIIVAKLSAIEMLSGVNMLCSDKTGTLTLNKMEIQEQCFAFQEGQDLQSLLVLSALAAKWREPPRDALDTMVLGAADLDECDNYEQLEFIPFDPTTKRTAATLRDKRTGEEFSVTKGAPHVIVELAHNAAEINDRVVEIIDDLASRGIRCLSVARTDAEGRWQLVGILTFLDPPRPDTKDTIRRSREYGVEVKMITGDHALIAKEMCRMLDLDPNILTADRLPQLESATDLPDDLGEKYGDMILGAGGFAQVFPEHKFMIVEALRQKGFTCAMTGDGVNDAPALKRADVGIAVHGATDAARAAADLVLTEPGLSVVVEAFIVSRQVFQRMLSFLTYRISATMQFVVFFFIALFTMTPRDYGSRDPNFQYFQLPVILFMLITLLNDGCLLTVGYDRTVASLAPLRWNMPVLFLSACTLSAVACGASLLLLWMALEGWSSTYYHDSVFHKMGLPQLSQGKVTTMLYLQVSVSNFLTLFSARTGGRFFFMMRPSIVLLTGAMLSLLITSLVACFWRASSPGGVFTSGLAYGSHRADRLWALWVWIYCIAWWFVQDTIKVILHAVLSRFDILGYRSRSTNGTVPSVPATATAATAEGDAEAQHRDNTIEEEEEDSHSVVSMESAHGAGEFSDATHDEAHAH